MLPRRTFLLRGAAFCASAQSALLPLAARAEIPSEAVLALAVLLGIAPEIALVVLVAEGLYASVDAYKFQAEAAQELKDIKKQLARLETGMDRVVQMLQALPAITEKIVNRAFFASLIAQIDSKIEVIVAAVKSMRGPGPYPQATQLWKMANELAECRLQLAAHGPSTYLHVARSFAAETLALRAVGNQPDMTQSASDLFDTFKQQATDGLAAIARELESKLPGAKQEYRAAQAEWDRVPKGTVYTGSSNSYYWRAHDHYLRVHGGLEDGAVIKPIDDKEFWATSEGRNERQKHRIDRPEPPYADGYESEDAIASREAWVRSHLDDATRRARLANATWKTCHDNSKAADYLAGKTAALAYSTG